MRTVLRIDTDGTLTKLDLDAPEGSLKVLQTAVGGYIECVEISRWLNIWVNEEFLFNEEFKPNPLGCALTKGIILGPIVLTGGVDSEGETLALPDQKIQSLTWVVNEMFA
jgi:hypothetical protein